MPAAWRAFTIVLNSCTWPSAAGRGVAVVRRQEGDRVVAPVVPQATLDEVVVVNELVHGHQFHGGDAEPLEVFDDRRVREARVGAAKFWWHVGVLLGETAHVGFVDDRFVEWQVRRSVVAPIEEAVTDHCLHHVWGAVVGVLPIGIVEVVAETGRRPVHFTGDRFRVRVEEQLRRVAPEALLGSHGPCTR